MSPVLEGLALALRQPLPLDPDETRDFAEVRLGVALRDALPYFRREQDVAGDLLLAGHHLELLLLNPSPIGEWEKIS